MDTTRADMGKQGLTLFGFKKNTGYYEKKIYYFIYCFY